MSEQPQRPTSNDDREGWKAYWTAQGMPWRTEPEIDEEQQRFLAERRAVTPDIEKAIYPFRDERGPIKLTRADVEWLLATHESGGMIGPVDWSDKKQRLREGLDIRGANLSGASLHSLPLAKLIGALEHMEAYEVPRRQRFLAALHLEGANLANSHLEFAFLGRGRLHRADLSHAHLYGADLYAAHLEGVNLSYARVAGTILRDSYFARSTYLDHAVVSDSEHGAFRVLDVRWGGVNLATIDWEHVGMLGEELHARERRTKAGEIKTPTRRLIQFERAVRANRQVALELRGQGLNEPADRFAYRAQLLQRIVLRRRRRFLLYLGSAFLGLIAGYGYKPVRSFVTYLVVVGAFAGVYALLAHFGLTTEHFGSWDSPLVLSVTSFHGRVFFAGGLPLTDWAARVGAVEAAIGLLVEIVFIATFTQRFFAR